jgi:hypothetical protein
MSPPDYTGLWKLLYDWQTIIAGAAAILGGWIAYRAGVIQARATRESADKQIAAAAAEITDADSTATDAVRREIIEFSKFLIGNLEICAKIRSGELRGVPRTALAEMMRTVEPVIYPAIASRIGRLPFPQQAVSFYARISEAKTLVEATSNSPDRAQHVSAGLATAIADSFITACQLARGIIEHVPNPHLDNQVIKITRENIDEALSKARQAFPDAESFSGTSGHPGKRD